MEMEAAGRGRDKYGNVKVSRRFYLLEAVNQRSRDTLRGKSGRGRPSHVMHTT